MKINDLNEAPPGMSKPGLLRSMGFKKKPVTGKDKSPEEIKKDVRKTIYPGWIKKIQHYASLGYDMNDPAVYHRALMVYLTGGNTKLANSGKWKELSDGLSSELSGNSLTSDGLVNYMTQALSLRYHPALNDLGIKNPKTDPAKAKDPAPKKNPKVADNGTGVPRRKKKEPEKKVPHEFGDYGPQSWPPKNNEMVAFMRPGGRPFVLAWNEKVNGWVVPDSNGQVPGPDTSRKATDWYKKGNFIDKFVDDTQTIKPIERPEPKSDVAKAQARLWGTI